MGLMKDLIRIWLSDPDKRRVTIEFPPELLNALDTLVFVTNERRRALGSAQGGVEHWGLVERDSLLLEAVADYIKQHLQVAVPRIQPPRVGQTTGRHQRR